MKDIDPRCTVGIVVNAPLLEADRAQAADRIVARLQDWSFMGAVIYALETGLLPAPLRRADRRRFQSAYRSSGDPLTSSVSITTGGTPCDSTRASSTDCLEGMCRARRCGAPWSIGDRCRRRG